MPKNQNDLPTYGDSRKRSAGFALVGFLTVLPFLLAVFTGVGLLASSLRENSRLVGRCESELYSIQSRLAETLNRLFALNAKALNLRTKHQIAQVRLFAAMATGNLAGIAFAERHLAIVEFQRAQLDADQRLILSEGNQLALRSGVRLRGLFGKTRATVRIPLLAVEPDKPGDVAPVYRTQKPFRDRQAASVTAPAKQQESFCSVSIEERASTFRATLHKIQGVHFAKLGGI